MRPYRIRKVDGKWRLIHVHNGSLVTLAGKEMTEYSHNIVTCSSFDRLVRYLQIVEPLCRWEPVTLDY